MAKAVRNLKERNYKHLAHLAQNLESTIFIGFICDKIRKERPNVPVITLHDGLCTTPDYVGYVRWAISDIFTRLGVKPKLKSDTNSQRHQATTRIMSDEFSYS